MPGLVVNGYENLSTQVNEMLQDEYSMAIFDSPDFTYLVGDIDKKPLTSLRLEISNS